MKFILGRKLEMTQIFKEDGAVVPVTKVQAGPCVVTQIKTEDKDGYKAVQFGYGEKKEKNIKKPQKGHLKGIGNFRYLREMRIKGEEKINLRPGDRINVSIFKQGDIVKVTGKTKGRGFQGVVKRHGFHGSPASHGHKDQLRMPGSIGATGPAHVFKGTRMPGHMGNRQVTVKNLEIIKVEPENNILYIKGAVPGARNRLVIIQGEGEMLVKDKEDIKDKTKLEVEDKNKK